MVWPECWWCVMLGRRQRLGRRQILERRQMLGGRQKVQKEDVKKVR